MEVTVGATARTGNVTHTRSRVGKKDDLSRGSWSAVETGSEKREQRKLGTGHDGPATAPALRLRRSLALLLFPPLSFVPLARSVSLPSPTFSVSLLLSAPLLLPLSRAQFLSL